MPDFGDFQPGSVKVPNSPLPVGEQPGGQPENKRRVAVKIDAAVFEFCQSIGVDGTFHMIDLQRYVAHRFPTAPDSSGRILRDLRARGLLNYRVVSRNNSEYKILAPVSTGKLFT